MNEDNKTVTMPLSEYRRMEEIVVQKDNTLEYEIIGLRGELEGMTKQNEELIERLETQKKTITFYEERRVSLEKEVDRLRSSWIAISNEKRDLEREKESLKEELARCKEEVYAKRVYLKSLEEAIEKLQTENEMLRKDLEEEEQYEDKPKKKWQFWK